MMEYRSKMMKMMSGGINAGVNVVLISLIVLVLAGCGAASSAFDRLKSLGGGSGEVSSGAGKGGGTKPVGEIVFLEGFVAVEGLEAGIGDELMDGETVVVGDDGYVEISFGDHRILRALAGTRLVLDGTGQRFVLEQGALGVLQSKARVLSRNGDWTLETPTVVAAVRGTVYFAKVESPDEVYFCLCNGRIHLEDSDNGGELDLDAAHHKAVRFIREDTGVVYESAAMLYHSDADMESLADMVNVPIDWTRIPD